MFVPNKYFREIEDVSRKPFALKVLGPTNELRRIEFVPKMRLAFKSFGPTKIGSMMELFQGLLNFRQQNKKLTKKQKRRLGAMFV